jgi:hypothetical protein
MDFWLFWFSGRSMLLSWQHFFWLGMISEDIHTLLPVTTAKACVWLWWNQTGTSRSAAVAGMRSPCG